MFFWRRRELSDDEYIEKLRGSIDSFDRWRHSLIVLYLLLAVFIAGAIWWFIVLLERMLVDLVQPNRPVTVLAFVTGTGAGIFLGWLFTHLVQGLALFLYGYRNERLLIKYHDALLQTKNDAKDEPDETEQMEPNGCTEG